MSTPRVGSSRRMTSASAARARAITTFCWLPPLSAVIPTDPDAACTLSLSIQPAASSRTLCSAISPQRASRPKLEAAMFSSIDHKGKMPSTVRSPETNATLPPTVTSPAPRWLPANTERRTWRWPLPSSPASPTISPRPSARLTPRRLPSPRSRRRTSGSRAAAVSDARAAALAASRPPRSSMRSPWPMPLVAPVQATRPLRMTVMRSASSRVSLRRWEMKMNEMPSARRRFM